MATACFRNVWGWGMAAGGSNFKGTKGKERSIQ